MLKQLPSQTLVLETLDYQVDQAMQEEQKYYMKDHGVMFAMIMLITMIMELMLHADNQVSVQVQEHHTTPILEPENSVSGQMTYNAVETKIIQVIALIMLGEATIVE